MSQLLAPLTAFTAALLVVWWLASGRLATLILDHPNPRSLHASPVPRTGGLGLHAGILLAGAVIAPGLPAALWAAYAALLLVSFLDDARGIPVPWRLAAHLAVSGLAAWALLFPDYGWFASATAALAIAWMINLYNFMDGSDGLAGGMAVIGFAFYGAAAWMAGSADFALLNFSIAAAAAGFLVFNLPPARIFMGDAGSVPLGFLAASLGAIGWRQGDWAAWFPLLVFAPFIADASVTLARRLARREKLWQAHRDHYYQRLVRMGWGHRKTALFEYGVMAAGGVLALAALAFDAAARIAALAAAVAAYGIMMALIDRRWREEAGNRK
ncbi:MAG TPA: glycosyltransferase family 4 protein [Burkholderiales bacterium]|nr:glycosyltransferase family 4 protein [Burkholderiales bacterium]